MPHHVIKQPKIKLRPCGVMRNRVHVTINRGMFKTERYLVDATIDGLTAVLDRQTAIDAYTLFHAIK